MMHDKPILLYPAYRSGLSTPWGGDGLKTCFGKEIPDPHTGESLEMSVIPGLNSVDADGQPLESLLDRDWAGMAGTQVERPFPLLLKLIDAQDRLSVQVHPDDDYARRVENKLGKTEPGPSCRPRRTPSWYMASRKAPPRKRWPKPPSMARRSKSCCGLCP